MAAVMGMADGREAAALLAPTEALLRGFVFDEPAPQPAGPRESGRGAILTGEGFLLREGFRIGELRLMIRYEDGNELTDLPAIYVLPRAPAWFRGMANLHGALVPVFDGGGLFAVAHDSQAKPMLLVLGHGEARAGVIIDGLPVRLRVTEADRIENAAVPPALAACVAGAYWSEGVDWLDLQVDVLLRQVTEQLAALA